MAVNIKNPFETSFETLSGQAAKGVKQVKKAAGDATSVVVSDVKQQMMPDYNEPLAKQMGTKQVSDQQQQQIQAQQQKNLELTRQNLAKIDAEMKRIREERLKKEQQKQQLEQKKSQEKKMIDEKKKEPVWKQMLKGKQGSKEVKRLGE